MSYNTIDQVGKGWHIFIKPIIDACEKENVKIFQIKEKFGTVRIYVEGKAPEYIHQYIQYAEWLSELVCEDTGKPGSLRDVGGWLRTLSDERYEELIAEKKNEV